MAATYYYIATPHTREVLDWFASQPDPPEVHPHAEGAVLYFRQLGGLISDGHGGYDATQSPVITLFEPQVRRGVLWSIGEVHFRARNARTSLLEFDRVRSGFYRWLKQYQVAWDRRYDGQEGYAFYLEGGIKNIADKVFVLPSGNDAMSSERYFVAHGAKHLDQLCKTLRLRGVNCD